MQSIWDAIKNGNGKERMAIAADIISIFGVSVFALLGGAFSINQKFYVNNLIGAIIISLLTLAGFALGLIVCLVIHNYLTTKFSDKKIYVRLLQSALWFIIGAGMLICVLVWFEYIDSLRYIKHQ